MKTISLCGLLCIMNVFTCRTVILAQKRNNSVAEPALQIIQIEPTVLFPKPEEGRSLKQLIRIYLDNHGGPLNIIAKVTAGVYGSDEQVLDSIVPGKSTVGILVPDIKGKTQVTVDLLEKDGKLLVSRQVDLLPQKKWTLYCTSYSHQDLGYGDYPHRLRTSIRHENIRLPLKFCRETDSLPDNDKYRFNIETSEPVTSFISFNGKDAARELAKRMREGRISLGGLHNTSNTEELSHELLARLFYMSGRYAVDLLGVPPNKTILNDDVIGLTWPLATFGAEADLSYFFHGYNGCGHCLRPAESEPVFYWQGPDSRSRLLMRSIAYGGYEGDNTGDGSETQILNSIKKLGLNWPYDVLLLQEGTDFQLATRKVADQIRSWNSRWAYPRLISATMDMYFNAIAAEADPAQVRTYALDANNEWSDQDYAAARSTGEARKLTELLPATEILATMSQALAGGGDQWIDLFQGYHRLLQYFEHTNSKDSPSGNMWWYETELEENREMVTESSDYQHRVFTNATRNLNRVINRTGAKNIIVFNPLPYKRTDIVRTDIPEGYLPVDPVSGANVPVQKLPDGSSVFIAADIPSTGFKTYKLTAGVLHSQEHAVPVLENRFYRIEFDRTTGTLTSLFDKLLGIELIEKKAPHAFNEYLYEFRTLTQGLEYNSVWNSMEKADSVTVRQGPVADVLRVTGRAEGVKKLVQTVILYHDIPRVDFSIWLDKLPFGGSYGKQHEAVFVALPLAIPDFTIRHELPGAVIEPYKQQFEGSTTAHYAIRSFTDLSNLKYGVTVSPVEGSLICYGEPVSSPVLLGHESNFRRDRTYPATSRLYLYLLNNMFDVNIAADQPGPVNFHWALRSHAGDWIEGGAERFGRSVQQPLIAWHADGKNSGSVQSSCSFLNVDVPNVMCSVIKTAESNGRGFILRFNETSGQDTIATISLPMLKVVSARATSLVENDRNEQYQVINNSFKLPISKFGVKTVRIICDGSPASVSELDAKAVADMRIDLSWKCDDREVSHFNIYRDTKQECAPVQLNFIGQSATDIFIDHPQVNIGGWLRSCLSQKTTYYYRIVPVDHFNNPGKPSTVAVVTTPGSGQANLPPEAVEGVRPILVSGLSKEYNFVNLLFRTSCEPDIVHYEIHRSENQDFSVNDNTKISIVNSNDVPPRSGGYGESRILYVNAEYDHTMFQDSIVKPGTVYFYKVRAVDASGQKGECSQEVSIRTR
jgi:hypothetical protein